MTTSYFMVAWENYDSTWVFGIDDPDGNPPTTFGLQDKVSTGVRFDPVRRKLLYQLSSYDTVSQTNDTGFTLWSGQQTIAPGGTYAANEQYNQSICEKNIDTGAVVFHQCYNAANLVPTGAGPYAFGWYVFTTNPTNGQNIILNGVIWTFVTGSAGVHQTLIQANTFLTIRQLAWDLAASGSPSLTEAYYMAGYGVPVGSVMLSISFKTGGTGGNAYTLAAGTYGGTPSNISLGGGGAVSDGTWRRFVESFSSEVSQDPLMVDPRTGNVWQHVDAFAAPIICAIYLFRSTDDFAQTISPLLPPPNLDAHMELVGISDAWVYVRLEQTNQTIFNQLMLTPREVTAEETTLDQLVPYVFTPYDALWNTYYFREVFNHSTGMFTFGGSISGTRAFKLYKFTEPTSAPFEGPVVGGGFADITPWSSSTGPNTSVTSYTVDGIAATPSTAGDNKYQLYYMPGTDELVIITDLWAGDTSTGWSDPTLTRFDVTYVQLGAGTFDYHQAFITGYMKANWTTTVVAADAAWVVLGVRELDLFLGQNTYDFSGLGRDYTKRWFYFEVQPVVAGVWSYDLTKSHIIMVQYQFTAHAVPLVVKVIDEAGWDTAFADYGTAIGNTNVVFNSIGLGPESDEIHNSGLSDGDDTFIWDAYNRGLNVCHLNPTYEVFRPTYLGRSEITGPFLKLSFADLPPSPILGNAFFIERMDNRTWPTVEDTWCVDCGLTTTPETQNAILTPSSATGLGAPVSITMDVAGQGYSAGTTATILDPTGTGAAVALTIASGMITGAVVSGGTGYTYPQVVFTDPAGTGFGAIGTTALDNSMTFHASAAVFDNTMIGQVIRGGGGRAVITSFTDTTHVTANMVVPITQTIPNSDGVPLPFPSGAWNIAPNITTVGGLWHLIGFTVTGVADGAVIPPQVVAADGTITLSTPASKITVGLAFKPQFQSLYLDGGSPTVQGQRKKVAEVTVRLEASGVTGIQGGSNQPTGSALSPPVQDVVWSGMNTFQVRPDQALPPYGSTTPPLFTGDVNQPVKGGFDKPGQVAFQQTLPLPMNITAIIPEVLEGDENEQGYQPKPQRPPSGRPKGGGR